MYYQLKKKGTFHLAFAAGNACGGFPGSSDFSYEFLISTDYLDARGFVIEHVEVSDFISAWAAKTRFSGTCEQVLEAVTRIIADEYKGDDMNAWLEVQVTRNGNATLFLKGDINTIRPTLNTLKGKSNVRRKRSVRATT